MAYQSIDPATGKLLESFEHLTNPQLETKLAAADACFKTWKQTSFAERAAILNKAGVASDGMAGLTAGIAESVPQAGQRGSLPSGNGRASIPERGERQRPWTGRLPLEPQSRLPASSGRDLA